MPEQHKEHTGLIGPHDVAALLGTTKRQVDNMRGRGQLPPSRKWPGLGHRWNRAAFYKWLEGGGSCE